MGDLKFNFEDLDVWKKAVDFSVSIIKVIESINTDRKHFRLIEQLESASTSVSLNIAEGKGRYSKKEFIRFLFVARGSLFETISLLIILNKLEWIDEGQLKEIKKQGIEVGKMINGLIKSII